MDNLFDDLFNPRRTSNQEIANIQHGLFSNLENDGHFSIEDVKFQDNCKKKTTLLLSPTRIRPDLDPRKNQFSDLPQLDVDNLPKWFNNCSKLTQVIDKPIFNPEDDIPMPTSFQYFNSKNLQK